MERGTAAEALITGKDISANHQLDAAESDCQVYVESENPHLLSRLLGQHLFEDQHGVEPAIKKAKRYIDIILG